MTQPTHSTHAPTIDRVPETPDTRVRWKDAFTALVALSRDPDDTTQVFKVIDSLAGDFLDQNVRRMREDPVGRRLLEERFSVIEMLRDREHLRSLPTGSLGRAYLEFMEREELSADGLADASELGSERMPSEQDPERQTFAALTRDSHDLWHVLTGYGRDPLGELCLLVVLTTQIRNRGTGVIAAVGLPQVGREYPGAPVFRAALEGLRIGRSARWLVAQDWSRHLERPIDEVRRELDLAPPNVYRHCLELHDPARSKSRVARERAGASVSEAREAA